MIDGDFILKVAQTSDMERLGSKKLSGGALRKLRFELALSQGEMGKKLDLSEVRVRHIENDVAVTVRPKVWRKLMELTGRPLEEVEKLLAIPEAADSEILDENIEPYGEVPVPEIPTFDLAIAAGPWTELPEVDPIREMAVHRDGRFRVRIRGDSMEKSYPDGSLVEFRCMRFDVGDGRGSRLEVGADYYVQMAESATFKKLESFTDDMLIFRAINKARYPTKIKVSRTDVARMAKAEYILKKAGEI